LDRKKGHPLMETRFIAIGTRVIDLNKVEVAHRLERAPEANARLSLTNTTVLKMISGSEVKFYGVEGDYVWSLIHGAAVKFRPPVGAQPDQPAPAL
jgi:hypothetical protein